MSSIYIVVHKPTSEEAKEVSEYLCEILNKLYPGNVDSHYNGSLITICGSRISIDIRCGINIDKFGGLWANYYYTEGSKEIADILEQGACKCNGRRLKDIEQVFLVVSGFMAMFKQIDMMLDEMEE